MKSFAPACLTLLLIIQTSSPDRYRDYAEKTDLVLVGWVENAELLAEGENILWTVTYKVNRVVKGTWPEESITLKFDQKVFTHVERAETGPGPGPGHSMVILFLKTDSGSSTPAYVGPLLNSPLLAASEENLAALEKALEKPDDTPTFIDWLKANKIGVILVGSIAFLLVLLVLVLKRK